MICVTKHGGPQLGMVVMDISIETYGPANVVEGHFGARGMHLDLSQTDVPLSGWDYVFLGDVVYLIVDLNFSFRRSDPSPMFIVDEGLAAMSDYVSLVRSMIRSIRIGQAQEPERPQTDGWKQPCPAPST